MAQIGTTLYLLGGSTDKLFTVSTTTGQATEVGNIGVDVGSAGLAAIGSQLYATIGNLTLKALYKISSVNGAATRVGTAVDYGVGEAMEGLTAVGDQLYAVGSTSDKLYRINKRTGVAEVVGTTASGFGVSETGPTGLTSIGTDIYMVGGSNHQLYKFDRGSKGLYQASISELLDLVGDLPVGLPSEELLVTNADQYSTNNFSLTSGYKVKNAWEVGKDLKFVLRDNGKNTPGDRQVVYLKNAKETLGSIRYDYWMPIRLDDITTQSGIGLLRFAVGTGGCEVRTFTGTGSAANLNLAARLDIYSVG